MTKPMGKATICQLVIGHWSLVILPAATSAKDCHAGSSLANVDRRHIRARPQAARHEALPAGPHAGAAVPLQSGLWRLREDSASGRNSQAESHAARVLSGGRG